MQTVKWTWKDAIFLITIFVVVYGLSIPLQFKVAELTGEMAVFEASENPSIPQSALLINHIAKAVSLTGGVAIALHFFKKQSWEAIGFRPTTRRWILISLAIGIVQYPLRLIGAKLLLNILPEFNIGAQNIFFQNDYSLAYNVMLFFIITLLVPISEEIFYRGFLFNWMKSHRSLWVAIFFSSLMFSVSHIVPSQVVMAMVLSMVITWVYHKSESIWTAILIHMVNNSIAALVALVVTNL